MGCQCAPTFREAVRGTKDSLVYTQEAKHPLILELRLHLRYTAGLSVGSHPQSSCPLGWLSSLFALSAKPRQSGTGPPVSRHPSIGKADICEQVLPWLSNENISVGLHGDIFFVNLSKAI